MRRTRVMLVDDDPSARFLMRTILSELPDEFEVVAETGRAQEAVGEMERSEADVVLLDAMMPVTDGYELAGQLRAARPGIRLVLLSAFVDESVRRRARAAGIDACVDKGDFDQVPRVVRDVVSPGPGASAAPG